MLTAGIARWPSVVNSARSTRCWRTTGARTVSGSPGGLGLDIALANLQAGFGRAFSDLQATEHDVIEDGDALVIRGENSATHTGWFLGIEPTGSRVSWEFLDMYRVGADGRLNWHFLATDWNLVRLQLLGQTPDLPVTPARRAVQVEMAQRREQSHPG